MAASPQHKSKLPGVRRLGAGMALLAVVLLAFARCLRARGITGFPDPNASGELSQEMISSAGVDIHTRSFFDAAKACVPVTHGAITVAEVAALISGHH